MRGIRQHGLPHLADRELLFPEGFRITEEDFDERVAEFAASPVEPLGAFCGFKVKVGTYEPGDDYGSFEYRLFLLVQDAEGSWFASLEESPLEDEEEASDLEVQATWVPVQVWF